MEVTVQERASHIKGRIAVICGALGHLYKGEYLIEPNCRDAVKDLIRLLKKDDETHNSRRCMGEINIVQNHLIHIIKNCSSDEPDLFNVTLRLLINVTTPAILLYGEEIPKDKINRHYYLSLVGHDQCYKYAFTDVEFWNKICCKLTNLFETEWTVRSADDSIEIERILTLLRNVLHIPGDDEDEQKPDNDTTVHDQVLWALRQSQILELLLLVSSNKNEEVYYLNLLEVFSLLLREHDPKLLGRSTHEKADEEKDEDTQALMKALEVEKSAHKKYSNIRNFKSTFVMVGAKSASNIDIVCHKSLQNLKSLSLGDGKRSTRPRRTYCKYSMETERIERRSTLSVRMFLKEFCSEFLNSGFQHFMSAVKNRLDSGKSLSHDKTYYFWAITFFMQFAIEAKMDPELIKNCLSTESFHFIYTNIESAFEHMKAEKKDALNWIKRIHMILKAYQTLLETINWMDHSKSPMVRAISREIKTSVFYVVEYRELTLHLLLRYEPCKFPVSYLRDIIQTTHLFIKLLEEFSKQTKLVVQKITKKRKSTKKKQFDLEPVVEETRQDKWAKISDEVYDRLISENLFPEVVPFDAALDVPIDDQKERAMFNIQQLLYEAKIVEAIGLLRSSRQVWPENDYFGSDGMTADDETMALKEICLADLVPLEQNKKDTPGTVDEEEAEDDSDDDLNHTRITEQDFNIFEYKIRLAHKNVVQSCAVLLKQYRKNSDYVNHCTIKLLHRIGWECSMPALLYQASLFWTLLSIMNENDKRYNEINMFTINLLRKFRQHAEKNRTVFLELLFWKSHAVAMEIQQGYEPYVEKKKERKKKERKVGKKNAIPVEEGNENEMQSLSLDPDNSEKYKELISETLFSKKGGKHSKNKSNNKNGKSCETSTKKLKANSVESDESNDDEDDYGSDGGGGDSNMRSWRKRLGSNLMLNSSDEDDTNTKDSFSNGTNAGNLDLSENRGSSEPSREEDKQNVEETGTKRRERMDESDGSDGNSLDGSGESKSKRRRFISSDSDEEIPVLSGKKSRFNVIDSDSDFEDDGSDIRSK